MHKERNECAVKSEEYMSFFNIDNILDKFIASFLNHNKTTKNDRAIIFLKIYGKKQDRK